jgi:hypothetical protein
MYCMALKVYTCEEAAMGPKTCLNMFCRLMEVGILEELLKV